MLLHFSLNPINYGAIQIINYEVYSLWDSDVFLFVVFLPKKQFREDRIARGGSDCK
jgi:hypothetical protein